MRIAGNNPLDEVWIRDINKPIPGIDDHSPQRFTVESPGDHGSTIHSQLLDFQGVWPSYFRTTNFSWKVAGFVVAIWNLFGINDAVSAREIP
jgi:hypothetical protein